MASRFVLRVSRSAAGRRPIFPARREPLQSLSNAGFHSLSEPSVDFPTKWTPYQIPRLLSHPTLANATLQRLGFSSTASPQPTEKEADESVDHDSSPQGVAELETSTDSSEHRDDLKASERKEDAHPSSESQHSKSRSDRRRQSAKRTAFSESDTEPDQADLSFDDLVKLVAEKEELLKLKHKEIEKMQDKVLRSYADMENVIDRTKREAENSKKFAIQNFAKSLLDVADNLGRASSVVKESFSKIDSSKDSAGAVPLLKTLLEGVEMTDKQLVEVFRKFGMEKFDPINEHFDPHRHHAVFQIPDSSKPPGTVAVVLKAGYMLYDRVLRPAEVGVTEALNNETTQGADE